VGLWVILPVYNEESAIEHVIQEWIVPLRATGELVAMCVVDDGSRDSTPHILAALVRAIPELFVVTQLNSGHGPACHAGYRLAVDRGAEWVFQIDSDGQCDPEFFPQIWKERETSNLVFGKRVTRDDGIFRKFVSEIVKIVVLLATGSWMSDPNVPYRLMRGSLLNEQLSRVPSSHAFPNIALSWLLSRGESIRWLPIRFRQRETGRSTVKVLRFVEHALRLYRELTQIKKSVAEQ